MLDRLTRSGRIGAPGRRFDVYLTEFGYQTSPPDHRVGISLGRQARYLQQASYLAWRQPRVRNLTQYQWRDEPVVARGRGLREYAGWQSGLRYINDRPKPAFRGFTEPFVIDLPPRRSRGRFWGQIRPGTGVRTVTILRRRPGQRRFRVLARTLTDARGFWSITLPVSGARTTGSPGSRLPSPPAARRRGGCRGSSRLASDPAQPVARLTAVSGEPERAAGEPPAEAEAAADPRGFYTAGYALADRAEADRMGRWRALGARSKADHAVVLCARAGAAAGDAGRDRLRRRRAAGGARRARAGARCSTASSSRPTAAALARDRTIAGARRIEAYDGEHVPAPDGAYDLAVLSHVVEHVEDPAPLLREAARVAPAVLVEVPLEANRSAGRAAKRAEAARIGHIQFLDRAAVHALVAGAGLQHRRRAERPPPLRPPRLLRHLAGRAGAGGGEDRRAARAVGRFAAGGRAAFTVHYACLARRSSVARVNVRELGPGETPLAARTLLELRPALGSAEALVRQIDERQRPTGYRLVGVFADGDEEAAAVAGFRINEYLAWEKHLYVDDLVTAAVHRGQGHADRLFGWLEQEARQRRLHPVPSRLGLGEDRQDAHRFYFRHGLRIGAYPLPARAVGERQLRIEGRVRGAAAVRERGCAELDVALVSLNSAHPRDRRPGRHPHFLT